MSFPVLYSSLQGQIYVGRILKIGEGVSMVDERWKVASELFPGSYSLTNENLFVPTALPLFSI